MKLKYTKHTSTFYSFLFFMIAFCSSVNAQITINPNQSGAALAQMLAGPGVITSNASFTFCDSTLQAGNFYVTTSNLPFDSGIVLTTGHAASNVGGFGLFGADGVPADFASNVINSAINTPDTDLSSVLINAGNVNDKCVLEFDFIPLGDSVKFNYVFASEEYPNYACTNFTDVFGFFISGLGITGNPNIALIPGTTIPVAINTINNGPGSSGGILSNCTQYGGASPYASIYNTNLGTSFTYNGFTSTLTAIAVVVPCSTYHLKLAIADIADWSFDSGVFLEAGSLSSNAISFTPFSLLSLPDPYLVEGCAPGGIVVSRPVATPLPYVVNYSIGGTATNGVDYAPLSGSVTILPNQTSAIISIVALTDALLEGQETVTIFKQAACATSITDSVTFYIFDSIRMKIITPDTTICLGKKVKIVTEGDSTLEYLWTPNAFIDFDTLQSPTVTPTNSGFYNVTATLPNSGCAPVKDSIYITINPGPTTIIGPDITICKNMTYQFNPTVTPLQPYSYQWSSLPTNATTFLSSTNVLNPLGTFSTVGVFKYFLKVDPAAAGCSGFDTITITVLPDDFILTNKDTTICEGNSVQVTIFGPNEFAYQWSPNINVLSDTSKNPLITPNTTTNYNCTATFPGCPFMNHNFTIKVEPNPIVNIGADREKCFYDTLRFNALVMPDTFSPYTYTWAPAAGLNATNVSDVVFSGKANAVYTCTVKTPNGCSSFDVVAATVFPANLASLKPLDTLMCPSNSVHYFAKGAVSYLWQPSFGLDDSTSNNPTATPISETTYTMYSIDVNGCSDTDYAHIYVPANATLNLGPDVSIFPGQVHQFYANGNCSYFNWSPSTFLDFTTISNPQASNVTASTQYIVNGTTEFNCTTVDTIILTMIDQSLINMPNAFSPGNGSSTNDNFKVQYIGDASLVSFRVFNRWGVMVFETTDINQGWNGRFNDTPQPMGTYVYQVEAKNNKGKTFSKSGNVTLIR
jgi:gliding motility-associated-like protein